MTDKIRRDVNPLDRAGEIVRLVLPAAVSKTNASGAPAPLSTPSKTSLTPSSKTGLKAAAAERARNVQRAKDVLARHRVHMAQHEADKRTRR